MQKALQANSHGPTQRRQYLLCSLISKRQFRLKRSRRQSCSQFKWILHNIFTLAPVFTQSACLYLDELHLSQPNLPSHPFFLPAFSSLFLPLPSSSSHGILCGFFAQGGAFPLLFNAETSESVKKKSQLEGRDGGGGTTCEVSVLASIPTIPKPAGMFRSRAVDLNCPERCVCSGSTCRTPKPKIFNVVLLQFWCPALRRLDEAAGNQQLAKLKLVTCC